MAPPISFEKQYNKDLDYLDKEYVNLISKRITPNGHLVLRVSDSIDSQGMDLDLPSESLGNDGPGLSMNPYVRLANKCLAPVLEHEKRLLSPREINCLDFFLNKLDDNGKLLFMRLFFRKPEERKEGKAFDREGFWCSEKDISPYSALCNLEKAYESLKTPYTSLLNNTDSNDGDDIFDKHREMLTKTVLTYEKQNCLVIMFDARNYKLKDALKLLEETQFSKLLSILGIKRSKDENARQKATKEVITRCKNSLAFFGVKAENKNFEKTVHHINEVIGEKTLRINPVAEDIFRRAFLIYFRTFEADFDVLHNALLSEFFLRSFPQYTFKRTANVFPNRQVFLEYESSIPVKLASENMFLATLERSDPARQVAKTTYSQIEEDVISMLKSAAKEAPASPENTFPPSDDPYVYYTKNYTYIHAAFKFLDYLSDDYQKWRFYSEFLRQRIYLPTKRGIAYDEKSKIEERLRSSPGNVLVIIPNPQQLNPACQQAYHDVQEAAGRRKGASVQNARLLEHEFSAYCSAFWKIMTAETCFMGISDPMVHEMVKYSLRRRLTGIKDLDNPNYSSIVAKPRPRLTEYRIPWANQAKDNHHMNMLGDTKSLVINIYRKKICPIHETVETIKAYKLPVPPKIAKYLIYFPFYNPKDALQTKITAVGSYTPLNLFTTSPYPNPEVKLEPTFPTVPKLVLVCSAKSKYVWLNGWFHKEIEHHMYHTTEKNETSTFVIDNETSTTIEQAALINYKKIIAKHQSKDYNGINSEGVILTTLFSLLFWDVFFCGNGNNMDFIPTENPQQDSSASFSPSRVKSECAKETPSFHHSYQICPADIFDSSFYQIHKKKITLRIAQIRGLVTSSNIDIGMLDYYRGHPKIKTTADAYGMHFIQEQIRSVHEREFPRKTMCRGLYWFDLDDLLDLADCIGPQAMGDLCFTVAQDYISTLNGVPDLILWDVESKEVMFAEVKSGKATLDHAQEFWIHRLSDMGFYVEIARVLSKQEWGGDEKTKPVYIRTPGKKKGAKKSRKSVESIESTDGELSTSQILTGNEDPTVAMLEDGPVSAAETQSATQHPISNEHPVVSMPQTNASHIFPHTRHETVPYNVSMEYQHIIIPSTYPCAAAQHHSYSAAAKNPSQVKKESVEEGANIARHGKSWDRDFPDDVPMSTPPSSSGTANPRKTDTTGSASSLIFSTPSNTSGRSLDTVSPIASFHLPFSSPHEPPYYPGTFGSPDGEYISSSTANPFLTPQSIVPSTPTGNSLPSSITSPQKSTRKRKSWVGDVPGEESPGSTSVPNFSPTGAKIFKSSLKSTKPASPSTGKPISRNPFRPNSYSNTFALSSPTTPMSSSPPIPMSFGSEPGSIGRSHNPPAFVPAPSSEVMLPPPPSAPFRRFKKRSPSPTPSQDHIESTPPNFRKYGFEGDISMGNNVFPSMPMPTEGFWIHSSIDDQGGSAGSSATQQGTELSQATKSNSLGTPPTSGQPNPAAGLSVSELQPDSDSTSSTLPPLSLDAGPRGQADAVFPGTSAQHVFSSAPVSGPNERTKEQPANVSSTSAVPVPGAGANTGGLAGRPLRPSILHDRRKKAPRHINLLAEAVQNIGTVGAPANGSGNEATAHPIRERASGVNATGSRHASPAAHVSVPSSSQSPKNRYRSPALVHRLNASAPGARDSSSSSSSLPGQRPLPPPPHGARAVAALPSVVDDEDLEILDIKVMTGERGAAAAMPPQARAPPVTPVARAQKRSEWASKPPKRSPMQIHQEVQDERVRQHQQQQQQKKQQNPRPSSDVEFITIEDE